MTDLINSGNSNSSTGGDNPLINSPFGPLSEVLSDEELSNIFSGLGNGEGSGSPFGESGNINPFASENFWDIFAGGVNPSAGGSVRDPLTGGQSGSINTTQIPDGFSLSVTIENLINSRLNEELDDGQIPSFDFSQIPLFGGGQIPLFDFSQIPSFTGGQTPPFDFSQIPSFTGGQTPPFDFSQIPSFGSGQTPPFDFSQIPSFGSGQTPPFDFSQIPSFGSRQIPFA
ncbi:hypothetical protein IQ276_025320 [Desmonostoc muscorum LEGE 12446]|uniref:Uncharacterized protein n=1 Tax=Desmonostoc muscorum LEGE 12446 TaxID=1828758 RepID=A0A8J6ZVW8_DESMC|nr:hypothetical protein [Desmonostoc muscorum]MCF2149692.1 hypothetical protein [Desmonostoc muscorum LEGE 12446]